MYVPAKNPTDTPVVIDFEGRALGGGDWGAVDRHDDVAEQAIADGRLVIFPSGVKAGADVDTEAVEASRLAEALEDRRRTLTDLDVADLRDHAAEVDLLHFAAQVAPERVRELYDEREKPELVRLLARRLELPLPGEVEPQAAPAPTVPEDEAPDPAAKASRTTKKAGGR